MSKTETILIVDDEDDICKLIAGLLADEGYKTIVARDKLQALAYFDEDPKRWPDAVLLDIWLEGGTREGLEILAAVKERKIAAPVIMMSGHGTLETAVEAIKTGAYDFLEKPFKTDRLLVMLQRAIEQASLRHRLAKFERGEGASPVIAKSRAMIDLLGEIDKLAPSKSRVLIQGEAGSGKSLVARLVHQKSGRGGACITVSGDAYNSAALHDAAEGTLILEQPEDLSPAAQSELTRHLQEDHPVRFITTTRADLPAMIKTGKFREDLYYRLNVVPLYVPPLRERKADIPDIVADLLPRIAHEANMAVPTLNPAELNWLQSQHWPGNVRELKNTLERFLILDRPLRENDKSGDAQSHGWDEWLLLPLKDARERFEHDYLEAQLLRHDRNITLTADFIGMDRAALHRKLKGLGLAGGER